MAYADHLMGPWMMYRQSGEVFRLDQAPGSDNYQYYYYYY